MVRGYHLGLPNNKAGVIHPALSEVDCGLNFLRKCWELMLELSCERAREVWYAVTKTYPSMVTSVTSCCQLEEPSCKMPGMASSAQDKTAHSSCCMLHPYSLRDPHSEMSSLQQLKGHAWKSMFKHFSGWKVPHMLLEKYFHCVITSRIQDLF